MGEAFRQLQKDYQFEIIDANRSVTCVTKELREQISVVLEAK
jgi:thymidylate kinase